MEVELLDYTKDGVKKIARLARSTREEELVDEAENPQQFIKLLLKVGHNGILEHIYFTFHISGTSRVLSHQLVRHRMASYLQMSSRHAGDKDYSFILPPKIDESEYENKFIRQVEKCYSLYKEMIDGEIPKEDARFILPTGSCTHISMTVNARELYETIFPLRCAPQAQWEIRSMAKEMLKICNDKYPTIFGGLYEKYINNDSS